jgi:rare lipoprotein A
MLTRRKFSKLNVKTPFQMWFLAGASSVALAAVVTLFATGTVQADVRLFRPAPTPPAASPVTSATPDLLTPQKTAEQRGDKLHGVASWYGSSFNGRLTASGERYDMYAMTACHPTLPFGSIVRVVNRINHRSVVVRINDRGLLYKGRIMDLSYGAATKLAMIQPGLAQVDIHVLALGKRGDKK